VSVQPVDVLPFSDRESVQFINSLSEKVGFNYLADLTSDEAIRIGRACDGIPVAMRWLASQCSNAAEIGSRAEHIEATGQHGEELLEFCFRRVFESLPGEEKTILKVLSLFNRPLPSEALLVATGIPAYRVTDTTDTLLADGLVQRLFDPDLNDYSYTLLPITRSFAHEEVKKELDFEKKVRHKLTGYYEATDVSDRQLRVVIREIRQGKSVAAGPLLDLAKAAERRGDREAAEALFVQALQRSPASWRTAQGYAEFLRHTVDDKAGALKFYAQAAVNAPRTGPERGLIFREWGMLLRDSGEPDATDQAIEKFEVALQDFPNDPLTRHALASMLRRKGQYSRVIVLLEKLEDHSYEETRRRVRPLLLEAYEQTKEMLKAAELREKMKLEGN
jgi:tetratricopeptide (TPR) repeat protein